ncbi:MAG TPA: hypothetical protein VMW49_05165 [Candidatus Dormibacteraeota bacterium]|nr:hypothetical protein [Candidatus Dormibacteraeota bacterium]
MALAGFLLLGLEATGHEERVLVVARNLGAGTVMQATTADLSTRGELVTVGDAASLGDLIPQADYASVAGSTLLVPLRRGELLLRHDLQPPGRSIARQVSLRLAGFPGGLQAGQRVDLFAVSGSQTGTVAPSADLCGDPASAGCIEPLAAGVLVRAVDPATQTIEIAVPPAVVSQWLFMDATQLLWAVPAGPMVCPTAEVPVSDPSAALAGIHLGSPPVPPAPCKPALGAVGRASLPAVPAGRSGGG